MRKNVASQVIAAQLVSKADGSDVTTGTTAVYVTIDGGTQATTGSATHEGQGCWTYLPSQAQTNGNHVAFTFVNGSACSVTVNVYPVSYDPTDPIRLGLTALPNAVAAASGGLATVDAANAVKLQSGTGANQISLSSGLVTVGTNNDKSGYALTQTFPTNFASLGINASGHVSRVTLVDTLTTNSNKTDYGLAVVPPTAVQIRTEMDSGSTKLAHLTGDAFARIGATGSGLTSLASQASVTTVDDFLDTEVAAIKAVADKLDTALELDGSVYRLTANALEQAPAGGGGGATDWDADERDAIRTILGIPASGTTPDVPSAGALKVIDDYLDTELAAVKAKTDLIAADPAAAVWAFAIETGITARQALALIGAAAAGKASGLDTDTAIYYAMGPSGTSTARITAQTDEDGNRTATTLALPA